LQNPQASTKNYSWTSEFFWFEITFHHLHFQGELLKNTRGV